MFQWRPKTQISGTGLTLVSSIAPTLGIPLPYWLKLAGLIVGVIMILWPGLDWLETTVKARLPAKARAAPMAALIICTIGLFVFSAYRFRPISPALNKPVTLFLECDPTELPTRLPESGRVWAIELAWNPNVPQQGGQNREMYGQSGLPLKWFDDSDFRSPYMCELINYGTAPIFNLFLEFKAAFYSYIPVAGTGPILGHAGRIVSKAKTNIRIPRLDIGPQSQFVFYIYNQSPYDVELSLPKVAIEGTDDFGNGGQPEAITANTVFPLAFGPRANYSSDQVGKKS